MSTLALLVQWRRSPGTVALPWLNPLAKLPSDIWEVLEVANGEEAATAIAAAATGAPGAELRGAALAFIREVLQAPGATFYRRLGVEQSAPIEAIRDNYRDLISVFHPDRMGSDSLPGDADIAAAINEAYNTLKHPESRAKHDRLRMATVIEVPSRPPFREPAPGESKPAAGAPQRDRSGWRQDKAPNPFVLWARRQSPRKLKLLAFGVLLAVAVGAVWLTTNRDTPTLAIATPGDLRMASAPALVLNERGSVARADGESRASVMQVGPRDVPRAEIQALFSGPRTREAGRPEGMAVEATTSAARPTSAFRAFVPSAMLPEPHPAIAVRNHAERTKQESTAGSTGVVQPRQMGGDAAESTTTTYPAVGSFSESQASQVGAATISLQAVPSSVPVVASAPMAMGRVKTNVPPAVPANYGLEAATIDDAGHGAAIGSAIIPSEQDIESLLSQFARAYDAGDMKVMIALVEANSMKDDRIALTLANFQRVFRETRTRHLDLHLATKSIESDRVRLRLKASTQFSGSQSQQLPSSGELWLLVARRGGAVLIDDIQYKDASGSK